MTAAEAEAYSSESISPLRKINLVFRFSYTIPFFLASVCGIVYAIPYDAPLYVMVLIPAVVLLLAMLVNFSNDYFDHKSGVDKYVDTERMEHTRREVQDSEALAKVYWEGNQFDTGLVTEKQGKIIIVAIVAFAVILAVPILMYSGWTALVFGAIGLFLAYFYTAPPVNFGARGLGEAVVGVAFFMMCFCSFYVAADAWDTEIFVFSVMLGLVVALMRLVDSLSAVESHRRFGEKGLCVRIGVDRTVPVIKALIVIIYAIAAVLCYFSWLYLALFLTLPIMIKSWRTMNAKPYRWDIKIIPDYFFLSLFTELIFLAITAVSLVV